MTPRHADRRSPGSVGRTLRVMLAVLVVTLVAVGVWLVFAGSRALAAEGDLQDAVDRVRAAASDGDVDALTAAGDDAQDAAQRADDALDNPVWIAIAAIPYLGDTAEAARITTAAIAAAAGGLDPLLDVADVLDAGSLYSQGRFDLDRVDEAQRPLARAAGALADAEATIERAPTADEGAWVMAPIDTRRAAATAGIREAAAVLRAASSAAEVLPALLGAEGPRTWFVGLQTPAEARGTGGLPGNFAVLEANDGRLDLALTGNSTDMTTLPALPDFGEDFRTRYGEAPDRFGLSNLSPHFPYAGQLWREFYATSLGAQADVVAGIDVVALGSIVEATGPIPLPDGRRLDSDEIVEYLLKGIYVDYGDRNERKERQESVTEGVFTALTGSQVDPDALVSALTAIVAEGRLQLWSPEPEEQDVLIELPTSGSVAATSGTYAYGVLINATGSKLDSYLERRMHHRIEGCVDGQVSSTFTIELTSAIPEDVELPEEVVGLAQMGPSGPVSTTQVQVHLTDGAVVDAVRVDDAPVPWLPFEEQGRPVALVEVDLTPRVPVTVQVRATEPAFNDAATIPVQPLALPAEVTSETAPCVRQ